MLVLEVGNVYSHIRGYVDDRVGHYLDQGLSFAVDNADKAREHLIKASQRNPNDRQAYARAQRIRQWDGRKHLLTAGGRFPTGLLNRMMTLLNDCQYPYDLVDRRTKLGDTTPIPLKESIELYPYQREAVTTAVLSGNGTVRIPTGGGKTIVGGAIMSAIQRPAMFLVCRRDLMYQAIDDFKKIFQDETIIGQIGDGIYSPNFITVATIQTLCSAMDIKYEKDSEWEPEKENVTGAKGARDCILRALANAEVLLVDEVQHVAAETCLSVMQTAKKAMWRLGLSATDWRDDGGDMLIEAAIGPRIVSIQATDLIEQDYLVPPRIFLKMMVEHEEGEHYTGPDTYSSIYKHFYATNRAFHNQIADINREWLAQGRTILTLVTSIAHGEALEKLHHTLGLPGVFLSGRDGMDKRRQVLNDVRCGRLRHLIATSIADEGLNLPVLDALNLAGGGKSTTRAYQRIGRVIRRAPGKLEGWVVDYHCPDHKYLDRQYKRRVEIYQAEKAFILEGK